MTLNLRIALICALGIFASSFLGSYKSFQTHSDQMKQQNSESQTQIAEWIGKNLEQKIKHVEASVSYLDQSTVETLRRFGARYFAYAFLKKGEWSLKWKVLGSLDKNGILAEVDKLDFEKLKSDRRQWRLNESGQAILISPVELAESHQLKTGFLVFGLDDGFFASTQGQDGAAALVSADQEIIFGSMPDSMSLESLGAADESAALFLDRTQLWLVQEAGVSMGSYLSSSFFVYALIFSILSVVLVVFFTTRLKVLASHRELTDAATDEVSNPLSAQKELIPDFGDFLDSVLADDMERMTRLGVQMKTQVEEGATVVCSPQHVSDFLKRLVGNSVLCLDGEDEKEIQIQLVEQATSYQLIYVDTRSSHFPSGQENSLLAQTEGSLEGIDGIVAYASWMFGDALTVAKQGFCLSVDLAKPQEKLAQMEEALPLVDSLPRIEIDENETDPEILADFVTLDTFESDPKDVMTTDSEPSVSFDDVIEQFKMKEFSFANEKSPKSETLEASQETVAPKELEADEKGMFELNSGQFKIKIRSPKKKDSDVDR